MSLSGCLELGGLTVLESVPECPVQNPPGLHVPSDSIHEVEQPTVEHSQAGIHVAAADSQADEHTLQAIAPEAHPPRADAKTHLEHTEHEQSTI